MSSRWMIALAIVVLTPSAVLAQDMGEHHFTVRVENVSTAETIMLSTGGTAPAPIAPVLYVVHTGRDPVFSAHAQDRGQGLELLAEDGDPSRLVAALDDRPGIVQAGAAAVPSGAMEPGPLFPGHAYELTFTASPGQRLTLVSMFVQSNDLFFAPEGDGIALFDHNGHPIEGDITGELFLWDAGTEVNEEPGIGAHQAPRQDMGNMGPEEAGVIRLVSDGFRYPSTGQVIRVTISVAS